MTAGIDGLEETLHLIGACDCPVRELLKLEADRSPLLDGEISSRGCKGAIEPYAAVIDREILQLIAALGSGKLLEIRRFPDRARCVDVEPATLIGQLQLRRIFIPQRDRVNLARPVSARARHRQHRLTRRRVLPIGQAERLREQV